MKNQHLLGRSKGFSIIEILIAVLILGVGLAGMTTLYKSNIDGRSYAKQSSIAADLAQQKMAELAPKLSAAKSGNDAPTDANTGIKFIRSWEVTEASDGTSRMKVSVNVPDNTPNNNSDNAVIVISTVGQNYTPDILYRALKIAPIAPKDPSRKAHESVSASSCSANLRTHCDKSKDIDGDGDQSSDFYDSADWTTFSNWKASTTKPCFMFC